MPPPPQLHLSYDQIANAGAIPVAARLAVDATSNEAFATIPGLSATITVFGAASSLLIAFGYSGQRVAAPAGTPGTVCFRVRVDGVQVGEGAWESGNDGNQSSGPIFFLVAASAGAHTVDVQWIDDNPSESIRPVAEPSLEGATLMVLEVPS